MDKKTIFLIGLFLMQLNSLPGQNEVHYDTVYVARDTIVETVEVIQYEYVYVDSFEWFLGAGGSFVQSNLESGLLNHRSGSISYPLVLKMTKGNFFVQTGVEYHELKFNSSRLEEVATEVEKRLTETVVVDTIYRYNDGNPVASIVTKEVESIYYETEYVDQMVVRHHDYSSFFVPLMAGYSFRRHDFSAEVGVGLGFNLLTSSGKEGLQKDFPDEQPVFVSYLGNFSLTYHLSDRFKLQGSVSGAWNTDDSILGYSQKRAGLKLFCKIF
jgi:hypothetical protein